MMQIDTVSPLTLTSVEVRSTIGDKLPLPTGLLEALDPTEALRDLTLPPKITELLASPLQALGFQLDRGVVIDPGDCKHKLSVAKGHELTLFFAHIPFGILNNSGNGNLQAVGTLGWCFEKGTKLYVYSENARDCDGAFLELFNRWWKQSDIHATFVPWRRLTELEGKDPEDRKLRVMRILALDLKPASAIGPGDMERLVSILTTQAVAYNGGPEKYFRDLVMKSSLPGNWIQEVLTSFSGVTDAVARNLIQWLFAKGENPSMSRYKALASVLQAVLGSVGVDERKFIMSIIREYQLVGDAEEIEKLRKEFLP